jgi:hypothetical protein
VSKALDRARGDCSGSEVTGPETELPRIVRFLGTDDSPDSSCPHCGATGRYIHHFVVEDGRQLAAMSGCAKLFPTSRIAVEEQRLRKKAADRAKKGWKLNQRDQDALVAIEQFYAGTLDERIALSRVDSAKRFNQSKYR